MDARATYTAYLRSEVEAAIERLIDLLDMIDGDEDFEAEPREADADYEPREVAA